MKKGIIFLNGNKPDDFTLKSVDFKDKIVICADGAYDYIKPYVVPDVLIGDFDSIASIPDQVNIKRFPVDKDYTDGHLAVVEAAERGVDDIEIYGAFGGRPDHEYANLSLLALSDKLNMNAVIKGDYDVYFVKNEIRLKVKKNMTVSIVPYTDSAHIISSEGLKFCASSLTLNKIHLIGISNEAISDEICVKVGEGSILLFVQRR